MHRSTASREPARIRPVGRQLAQVAAIEIAQPDPGRTSRSEAGRRGRTAASCRRARTRASGPAGRRSRSAPPAVAPRSSCSRCGRRPGRRARRSPLGRRRRQARGRETGRRGPDGRLDQARTAGVGLIGEDQKPRGRGPRRGAMASGSDWFRTSAAGCARPGDERDAACPSPSRNQRPGRVEGRPMRPGRHPGPATRPSPPNATSRRRSAVGRTCRDGTGRRHRGAARSTSRDRARGVAPTDEDDPHWRGRVGADTRTDRRVNVVHRSRDFARRTTPAGRRRSIRPSEDDVIRADRGELGGDLSGVRAVRVHQPDVPDPAASRTGTRSGSGRSSSDRRW